LKRKIVLSAVVIAILLVGLVVAFISYAGLSGNGKEKKPFLVGVTFGGNNVQDAKTLIDKVANYTNLFVLQSGFLRVNNQAINEIGDYATAKGLHFAAISSHTLVNATWISTAELRWGKMFAGVYFEDEPGGKMLDGQTEFLVKNNNLIEDVSSNGAPANTSYERITKSSNGEIWYNDGTNTDTTFYPNGTITVSKTNDTDIAWYGNANVKVQFILFNTTTYDPNGSITIREQLMKITNGGSAVIFTDIISDNWYTMENGSDCIAQIETYQQVKNKNPIPDCNTAANLYVNKTREPIEYLRSRYNLSKSSFPIFTADYGLYWWDYQSGYDMVLAELGWNNSVAQEIALVRGAANLQGKDWGTILTWKYTHAPYLTDGAEMFEQMRTSYECGAEYVVVFNYAEDMEGPYGTLQEEHFEALERFWNEIVQNPDVVHGGVKAEAALVLPRNYGWGMRNPNDIIWGLWNANSTSQQIWIQLQGRLEQYGTKLDIVYEDAAFPVAGMYANVYYWNQTT
jgi:hypothetical protein